MCVPGAVLPGVLARLPHRAAVRRLVAYEGPEYRLTRRVARDAKGRPVSVAVFLPKARVRAPMTAWHIDTWRRQARAWRRVLRSKG
jgi:hypothetical protein